MNTPFPGMDPYLEHPARWQSVHNRLIVALADEIAALLTPTYFVEVESRAYFVQPNSTLFVGRPGVAILSPIGSLPTSTPTRNRVDILEVELPIADEVANYYLEVREVATQTLVTTIELLSPVNKVDRKGRRTYLTKREKVFQSMTNLVEIDLLRSGEPLPLLQTVPESDYRILVSRSWNRSKAQLFTFNLRAPIPEFQLPLLPNEEEPTIKLNDVLHDLYERARYRFHTDYSQQPVPPLSDEDWEWAQSLINA